MEELRSESYSGNMGVCSERTEGSVIAALIERVMVVDGLIRSQKALISSCRSCGDCGMTVLYPSCVVDT